MRGLCDASSVWTLALGHLVDTRHKNAINEKAEWHNTSSKTVRQREPHVEKRI